MKTLFITGATGFVGSHTARLFLDHGWRVRGLIRNPEKPGLMPAGVEHVAGDLLQESAYASAMEGCDAVLHVAGLVKARSLAEYRAVNVGGSDAIARTVSRVCPNAMLVCVSSQAAAGPARSGIPLLESDAARPVSWYGQSKLEGEERVAELSRGPWCVIRPSVVYGAGDPGLFELFRVIQQGFAPIVAGGTTRVQLIAVEDLARILMSVAERKDLSGRRAFASGDAVSMRGLVTFISNLRRSPAWRIPVPGIAIRIAGLWESLRETLSGTARPFNQDKAREMLQRDWLCDSQILFNDLGISNLVGWEKGITALCRWYITAAWLRRDVWRV